MDGQDIIILTFNTSGKDIMSIYEIVERIAKHYGNSTENLNRISTATLKQKAGRPPKTGFILDKSRKETLWAFYVKIA